MKVRIKKLNESAVIPSYANNTDAGLDLVATSNEKYIYTEDQDGYWCLEYNTGIAIEIPEGYVGLIYPRSSISKKDLILANSVGVIDSGYRGEIKCRFKPMFDYKTDDSFYKKGDKIAQLIIIPYPKIEFEEVEDLSNTERGTGGFGSTDK